MVQMYYFCTAVLSESCRAASACSSFDRLFGYTVCEWAIQISGVAFELRPTLTYTTKPKKEYIFLYPNLFRNQPKMVYASYYT